MLAPIAHRALYRHPSDSHHASACSLLCHGADSDEVTKKSNGSGVECSTDTVKLYSTYAVKYGYAEYGINTQTFMGLWVSAYTDYGTYLQLIYNNAAYV